MILGTPNINNRTPHWTYVHLHHEIDGRGCRLPSPYPEPSLSRTITPPVYCTVNFYPARNVTVKLMKPSRLPSRTGDRAQKKKWKRINCTTVYQYTPEYNAKTRVVSKKCYCPSIISKRNTKSGGPSFLPSSLCTVRRGQG